METAATGRAAVLGGAGSQERQEDLQRLIQLIEENQVDEAWDLAARLAVRWPESGAIQHLAAVLQPPRVIARGGPTGRSLEAEYAWLRAHGHEYPGCWLAVYGDGLIASGRDRAQVIAEAHAALGDQ